MGRTVTRLVTFVRQALISVSCAHGKAINQCNFQNNFGAPVGAYSSFLCTHSIYPLRNAKIYTKPITVR